MYNLSDTITKSLKLAWQHKILWVFAILLGGGMRFNNFGNYNNQSSSTDSVQLRPTQDYDFREYQNLENFEQLNEFDPSEVVPETDLDSVLGTETSVLQDVDYRPIEQPSLEDEILSAYRAHLVLITLSVVVFFAFMIGAALIMKSWATGAFLNGIDMAISESPYTLGVLGSKGRISARALVKFRVLVSLTVFALTILLMLPILVLVALDSAIAAVFLGLALFLPFIVGLIIFSYAERFAIRYISLDGLGVWQSIKKGLGVFKRNFVDALVLSIANCFVMAVFGVVMLVVIFSVVFGGLGVGALASFESLRGVLIVLAVVIGIPLFFALVSAFLALGGYLTTYVNFTWSFFFNAFKNGEPQTPVQSISNGGGSHAGTAQ